VASVVGICNKALLRIGVNNPIAAITEASKEARACRTFYESSRDVALGEFHWPFAKRRKALALSGTAPEEWGYSYAYPEDCIAAREIDSGMRNLPEDQRIPFTVEDAEAGKLILTDEPEAVLIYTVRVEDPNRFSAPFEDALAWLLAAELAMPLSVKPELENGARERYRRAIVAAVGRAKNEEQPDAPPDAEAIRART
jgi:hypothetical protein